MPITRTGDAFARAQLRSVDEIEHALASEGEAGRSVRLIIALEGWGDARLSALLARAEALGIPIRRASAREMRRLGRGEADVRVLALVGEDARVDLPTALERSGVAWLLENADYPGNAGYVIRSAEVSGAAAVVVDARFDRGERRECLRFAMRADRFMPVFFTSSEQAIECARAARKRIIAIEDVGGAAPWEVDLAGDLLLVVGGEVDGISAATLSEVDQVVRVPMRGFIPSYNLQAAMAAVMGERLRQLAAREVG